MNKEVFQWVLVVANLVLLLLFGYLGLRQFSDLEEALKNENTSLRANLDLVEKGLAGSAARVEKLEAKVIESTARFEEELQVLKREVPAESFQREKQGVVMGSGDCGGIYELKVPGATVWVKTDLEISKGEILHFEAGGTISPNGSRIVGPSGSTNLVR